MVRKVANPIHVRANTDITTTYNIPGDVVKEMLIEGLKRSGIIPNQQEFSRIEIRAEGSDGYDDYNILVNGMSLSVNTSSKSEYKVDPPK